MRLSKQYLTCLALTWLVAIAVEPCLAQDAADVAKVIVPFVEKHCVQCHGEKESEANVSLHSFQDDESILKANKIWLAAVEKVRSGEMPAQGKPRPSSQEIEQFVKNVFERFARSGKRNSGRAVMRRLSKYEYQTTIRDLLGVTIPLGDSFPSDNVTEGFDNIADSLAISPVYIDGYMAAAETILKAAIVVGEPPPLARQITNGSQDLKPIVKNGQQDKQGRFNRDAPGKAIDPKSLVPSLPGEHWSLYCETGPLQRAFKKLVDLGEYQFVARRQGYRVVDKRPKFTLLVNGKVVPHGECGDAEEDHVAIVQLQPRPIRDRLELSDLESDPTDPAKKSGVIVHRFSLISPMMPSMHAALLAAPKELEERRNRGIWSSDSPAGRIADRPLKRKSTA